jgi:hypothetical protein
MTKKQPGNSSNLLTKLAFAEIMPYQFLDYIRLNYEHLPCQSPHYIFADYVKY